MKSFFPRMSNIKLVNYNNFIMIITRRWHCILRREIARHIEALSPWHRDLINPSRHRAIANQGSFSDAAKIIDPPHKDKKYVDRLTVTARAGNGGKGCVSFWQSSSKGRFFFFAGFRFHTTMHRLSIIFPPSPRH